MNPSSPDLWIASLKTLGMLSIVLSFVILFFFLIKKLSHRNIYGQSEIKIISSSYIGPRKQIILIDVMNEKFVLGVTSEKITCLGKIDNKNVCQYTENQNNQEKTQNNFFENIITKTNKSKKVKNESLLNLENEKENN